MRAAVFVHQSLGVELTHRRSTIGRTVRPATRPEAKTGSFSQGNWRNWGPVGAVGQAGNGTTLLVRIARRPALPPRKVIACCCSPLPGGGSHRLGGGPGDRD